MAAPDVSQSTVSTIMAVLDVSQSTIRAIKILAAPDVSQSTVRYQNNGCTGCLEVHSTRYQNVNKRKQMLIKTHTDTIRDWRDR